MARWFQFQQKTEPVPIGTVPLQRFILPWSEPVRQKVAPALAVALIASGLFAPPFQPPSAAVAFVSTTSAEVIIPRSIIYQSQTSPILPPVTSAIETAALSSPVFFKGRFIYQGKAEPVTTAEVITVSKWFEPWTEPVRRKPPAFQQALFWVAPAPTTFVAPEVISDDVIFPRSFIYQSLAWAPRVAETVTVDKWFRSWAEPTRRKPPIFQQALGFSPFPVVPFSYYNWLSEPIRVRYLPVAHRQAHTGSLQPIVNFGYFSGLSEPTRLKKIPPTVAATTPVTVTTEVITEDKWHQAWSTPVRVRGLLASEQQFLALPAPVTVSAAIVGYAETSGVIYPRSFIYQSQTKPVFPPVSVAPTFFNLTQGDTGVIYQQTTIYQTVADAVGPIANYNSWYAAFSEPVRQKRGLAAADQQFFAGPATVIPNPVVTAVSSESPAVIFPRSIIYQSQTLYPFPLPNATVVTGFAVSSEVIYKSRFIYQSLARPVFTPAPVVPTFFNMTQGDTGLGFEKSFIYQSIAEAPVETIFVSKYYQPWAEPVRLRRFNTALHQSLIWSNFTPPPPTVNEDSWHYAWSEPVRLRRFNTALQQSLAFVALLKNASNTASPYYPWSEPVRQKIGLKTYLQSFTSLITPPQPNFIRTINWYQWYSEPVRQKKGLGAWLQQFFDTDHNKPPAAPVFLVMNATEVNSDVASFAINVYNSSPVTPPPFTVKVSITEVQSGTNPWSIEEV